MSLCLMHTNTHTRDVNNFTHIHFQATPHHRQDAGIIKSRPAAQMGTTYKSQLRLSEECAFRWGHCGRCGKLLMETGCNPRHQDQHSKDGPWCEETQQKGLVKEWQNSDKTLSKSKTTKSWSCLSIGSVVLQNRAKICQVSSFLPWVEEKRIRQWCYRNRYMYI